MTVATATSTTNAATFDNSVGVAEVIMNVHVSAFIDHDAPSWFHQHRLGWRNVGRRNIGHGSDR
jgi:hypothetical protein